MQVPEPARQSPPALPLLLIPGFMCDARLFAPQIAALSRTRPVHVANVTGQDCIEDMAAAVLRNAPLRFVVAGLSMGGMVAMAMLAQAPARIAGAALLDTDPLPEPPKVIARRTRQMQRVRDGELPEVMREIASHYLPEGPRRGEVLELCLDMALGLGPEVFIRQAAALRDRPDLQAALSGWRGPTLVLCGGADAMCPPERHELMHRLVAGSRLEVIPGAGHLPTVEAPDAVTSRLETWLAG